MYRPHRRYGTAHTRRPIIHVYIFTYMYCHTFTELRILGTCIIHVQSFNTYTRVVRADFSVIRWSSTAYTSEIQTLIKSLYIHKHIHTCIVIHVQTPQTLRKCTLPSTHHTCIDFTYMYCHYRSSLPLPSTMSASKITV